MTGQFDVTPEELHVGAADLDEVSAALQQALDAARTVSLPTEAYGLICQFFPPLLDPVENSGTDTIAAGRDATGSAADRLRASAGGYRSTDDTTAGGFGGGVP